MDGIVAKAFVPTLDTRSQGAYQCGLTHAGSAMNYGQA